jgi:hypothetical protein
MVSFWRRLCQICRSGLVDASRMKGRPMVAASVRKMLVTGWAGFVEGMRWKIQRNVARIATVRSVVWTGFCWGEARRVVRRWA